MCKQVTPEILFTSWFLIVFFFSVVYWTVLAVQRPSREWIFFHLINGTEHGSPPSLTTSDRELVSVLELRINPRILTRDLWLRSQSLFQRLGVCVHMCTVWVCVQTVHKWIIFICTYHAWTFTHARLYTQYMSVYTYSHIHIYTNTCVCTRWSEECVLVWSMNKCANTRWSEVCVLVWSMNTYVRIRDDLKYVS